MMQTSFCGACGALLPTASLSCEACHSDPRLNGRYVLREQLGQGSNGSTWRAYDEVEQREVCLKALGWSNIASLDEARRLERETAILAQLDHPAIPKFYGSFSQGQGRTLTHYLILEFIEGTNLEVERKNRSYRYAEILQMAVELSQALHYLHTRSSPLVHRDLKPSNIMRRPDGSLVLINYGATRLDKAEQSQLSRAGTLGYVAPEQLGGESTPASDIYSLGILLGVLASGKKPIALLNGNYQVDFGIITKRLGPLKPLLTWMCHPDPTQRPVAKQVLVRMQALLKGTVLTKNLDVPISEKDPSKGFYLAILFWFIALGLMCWGMSMLFEAPSNAPPSAWPLVRP